jgi:hypothetical protein
VSHALALAEDGLVYSWALNERGSLLGNPHPACHREAAAAALLPKPAFPEPNPNLVTWCGVTWDVGNGQCVRFGALWLIGPPGGARAGRGGRRAWPRREREADGREENKRL